MLKGYLCLWLMHVCDTKGWGNAPLRGDSLWC